MPLTPSIEPNNIRLEPDHQPCRTFICEYDPRAVLNNRYRISRTQGNEILLLDFKLFSRGSALMCTAWRACIAHQVLSYNSRSHAWTHTVSRSCAHFGSGTACVDERRKTRVLRSRLRATSGTESSEAPNACVRVHTSTLFIEANPEGFAGSSNALLITSVRGDDSCVAGPTSW